MAEGRRYKILSVLGKGGFGTVYVADLLGEGGFTRKVALKVLNPEMAGKQDVANRLRDEARLLGLLRHRAIVHVDGLVLLEDRWTVVMEYIEGADLQRVIRGAGPVPLGPALEIISEVASALDVAYITPGPSGVPLQLLHRDIKPPNILLTAAGEAKVLDFGIARAEFSGREAQTRSVLYGSIGYMAPERLEFEELPAGDVYALGTVLFELLDGSPLGKSSINPQKHTTLVEDSVLRLMRKLGSGSLPPEFRELLTSMLAYDPVERPSAREVERRCRALRGIVGEPWLRDWAETRVPPLLTKPADLQQDDFSGSIVVEQSTGSNPKALMTSEAALEGPSVEQHASETFGIEVSQKPKVKRGSSMSGILISLGCLILLVGGMLGAVLVVGVSATGGLVALTLGMSDTGVAPYIPPPEPLIPELTTGDFNVDVPVDDSLFTGSFGASGLIEPWASMNLPIGQAAILSSDTTSLVLSETGTTPKKMGSRFATALQKNGWTLSGDYPLNASTISQTYTRNGRSLFLAVVEYNGMTMVTLSSY